MSANRPLLSLIVPTRGRPGPLNQFLHSIAITAINPKQIEVVLVVDSDDALPVLPLLPFAVRIVVGSPGRTMGELNRAGYAECRGAFVMLLNDDVVVKTRGWDRTVLKCLRRFRDPVVLVHVNDTLMRDHLCTFPILARECVELLGEICPADYERYRIDDHIQDPFDMLAAVGVRRTIYFPDVIFEHRNAVNHPTAGAVYQSDPEVLSRDAPRFEAMMHLRKEQVMKLLERIEGRRDPEKVAKIEAIVDSFALRVPGRQIVVRAWGWRVKQIIDRLKTRYALSGVKGLLRAAVNRFALRRAIP